MPPEIYEVKSGDTLWKIVAKEFSLKSDDEIHKKVKEVAQKNKINGNSIFIGQKINLETENGISANTIKKITTSDIPTKFVQDIAPQQNTSATFNWQTYKFTWWDFSNQQNLSTEQQYKNDSIKFVNYYNMIINSKNKSSTIEFYSQNTTTKKTDRKENPIPKEKAVVKTYKITYTEQDKQKLIAKIEKDLANGKKTPYTYQDLEKIKKTKVYSQQEIDTIIKEEAQKYGLDPILVKAIIAAESESKQFEKNFCKATGLMQLTPIAMKEIIRTDKGHTFPTKPEDFNLFDAKMNIQAGVRLLSRYMKMFKNDDEKALTAYNAGERKVNSYLQNRNIRETNQYLRNIEVTREAIVKDLSA